MPQFLASVLADQNSCELVLINLEQRPQGEGVEPSDRSAVNQNTPLYNFNHRQIAIPKAGAVLGHPDTLGRQSWVLRHWREHQQEPTLPAVQAQIVSCLRGEPARDR